MSRADLAARLVTAIGDAGLADLAAWDIAPTDAVGVQSSTQGEVWVFGDGAGRPSHVLKRVLTADLPHAASVEYRALERFGPAAASRRDIVVPELIGMLSDGAGYVMAYIEARPLARVLREDSVDGETLDRYGSTLVSALGLFHDAVGAPYGDFHHYNVHVDAQGRLVLLDPTLARPVYREVADAARYGWVTADIGHWLFSMVQAALKEHHRENSQLGLARVAEAMLTSVAERDELDHGAVRRDAFGIARHYARRLVDVRKPRGAVLGVLAWIGLAGLRIAGLSTRRSR